MTDNYLKITKIWLWFITIILTIILVPTLFSQSVSAFTVSNITITDMLLEDLSVNETIEIYITKNNQSNFTFTAPNLARELYMNNISMNNSDSEITTPLNCTSCLIIISFQLDNAVIQVNSTEFDYSRNLGLPQIPNLLSYTLLLPAGYYLNPTDKPSINPSIVPQPSKIETDGKNIVIKWIEYSPELPKTYYIKYYSASPTESLSETIRDELAGTVIIWIIFIVLIVGVSIGFFIGRYYTRSQKKSVNIRTLKNSKSLTVPKSLLNPDEKTIITVLQDNHNSMTQKDIGRKLEWSKSKVSAIMTNLEYKKIVEREKIGRNYKVELKKEMEDT